MTIYDGEVSVTVMIASSIPLDLIPNLYNKLKFCSVVLYFIYIVISFS